MNLLIVGAIDTIKILTSVKTNPEFAPTDSGFFIIMNIAQKVDIGYPISVKKLSVIYGPQIEVWKDIPSYEGLYQVSNYARVLSLNYNKTKRRKLLKLSHRCLPYLSAYLSKNGEMKAFSVHVLVAMAFHGHTPDGTHRVVVDHKDNNPLNNRSDNLQLITQRLNASKDKINKTSCFTGVSWYAKLNKWVSQIQIDGIKYTLGYFNDEQAANEAYLKAASLSFDINRFKQAFPSPKVSSKYRGVSWNANSKMWKSTICINSKSHHIGYFKNEIDAANAYLEFKHQRFGACI